MKRLLCIVLAAAFCAQPCLVFAQDASEPNEQSVLEKARDKYARSREAEEAPVESGESGDSSSGSGEATPVAEKDAGEKRPYTPVVLAFVPGLQNPLGIYDVSIAVGVVGSAVGSVQGLQGSGVFNIAEGTLNGIQGAGVFNMARDVDGFQGAGVFNLARNVDGFQGSGVFNMARDVDGFQGSGVFNLARNVDGFQISGCFNIADEVDGGMIAPVFNVADSVDGVMVGLVNVADHVDGISFGLINLIGDGVNEVGVQYVPAEDMAYVQYRSGTKALYAVYYGGVGSEDWFKNADSLIVGAGLGHRIPLNGGGLDFEFCAEQELYPERLAALSAAADAGDSEAFSDQLRPYPSMRASVHVPLFGCLKVFLGMEADFDVPEWNCRVPDRARVSSFGSEGWGGELFGLGFTAWPKLFVGVSFF